MKILRYNLLIKLMFSSLAYAVPENNSNSWQAPEIHLSARKGSVINRDTAQILPAGPSWYTLLETYHLPVVLNSADLASAALTERSYLNQYGSSVLWQNFFLNGLNLNDPSDPGKPVFEIPFRAANRLKIQGAMADANSPEGYSWEIENFLPAGKNSQASLGSVFTVGGPQFIGAGVFDREPANLWGAPTERRSFLPSFEADAAAQFSGLYDKPAGIFAETIHHRRKFVSLANHEYSGRHTLMLNQQVPTRSGAGILIAGLQHAHRELNGADDFVAAEQANAEEKVSGFLLLSDQTMKYKLGISVAAASDSLGNYGILLQTNSIESEINNRPAEHPFKRGKFLSEFYFQHANLLPDLVLPLEGKISGGVRLKLSGYQHESVQAGYVYARTYHNAGLDALTAITQDKYSAHFLHSLANLGYQAETSRYAFEIRGYLHQNLIWSMNQIALSRVNPAGSLRTTIYFSEKKSELYFGLKHDVIQANATEASYLINSGAAFHRHTWNDANADGKFTASEKGNRLGQSGAPYHTNGTHSQPVFEELCVGYENALSKAWSMTAQTTARLYRNLYRVSAENPVNYALVNRPETITGYLYNRTDADITGDKYRLTNNAEDSVFLALELQLLRKNISSAWYLSASGGAYYQTASNIPGNGVYYNDIGRFSEVTADPNTALNSLGRTDYDRGYIFKISTGTEIAKNLMLVNMLRYRDGIPVGETRVANGLSQGTVVYMDAKRANAEQGIGRFAFYMQWDIRLSYKFRYDSADFFAALDVYNVNDFRLELKERYLYDTNYRDPVESMMGRSVRVTLNVLF